MKHIGRFLRWSVVANASLLALLQRQSIARSLFIALARSTRPRTSFALNKDAYPREWTLLPRSLARIFTILLSRPRWLPARQIAFWFALNRKKLWALERWASCRRLRRRRRCCCCSRIPRLGGVHTTNAAGRILNHKFMVRSLCPLAASSYRAGKRAWRYFNAVRCFLQRAIAQLDLVRFVCPFKSRVSSRHGEEFGRMNQMSDQIWTILEIWLKLLEVLFKSTRFRGNQHLRLFNLIGNF